MTQDFVKTLLVATSKAERKTVLNIIYVDVEKFSRRVKTIEQ